MKTNLSTLMTLIAKEEDNFSKLSSLISSHTVNTSIVELSGHETVIEDYKEDFQRELKELEESNKKLNKYKKILYEKNNTFKLSDGRTIQDAILENTNDRKLKSVYQNFVNKRSTKSRYTEVNNSYFEVRTINFDKEEIKSKIEALDKKIEQTDFEISKLNSKEFTI